MEKRNSKRDNLQIFLSPKGGVRVVDGSGVRSPYDIFDSKQEMPGPLSGVHDSCRQHPTN